MTVRQSPLKLILATILVLGAPIAFRAQEHPVAVTFDLFVAEADQVVIGRIIEVGDATPTADPYYRQPIVLAVDETLKGKPVQRLSFDLGDVYWQSRVYTKQHPLPDHASSSVPRHRLLVMMRRDDTYGPRISAIDLDGVDLPILTADLVFLTKPQDIVQSAKEEISRSPMNSKSFMWPPPHDYDSLKGTPDAHCDVYVPIDDRVEKRAHALLDGPSDPIQHGETTHTLAIDAIKFFKSDENVRLLKGLLSDHEEKTRQEVYRVLKGWGVDTPKMALPEDANRPAPAPPVSLQNATIVRSFDARMPPDRDVKLAFGDGNYFYAIGSSRALTYLVYQIGTMNLGNAPTTVTKFDPNTEVDSITSDGRKAILVVTDSPEHVRLILFDAKTGQREAVPSSWDDSTDSETPAALSGDGRLLSIFSASGIADSPLAVTVYDWPTKTLVAKRTSEWLSAGGAYTGGVTSDGQIEFVSTRGKRKLIDLKTGALLAWFGLDSLRSPDGKWVVDFPDRNWNESAPKDVVLKDGTNGQTRGKLNLDPPVSDDESYGTMSGAFCGNTGRFVVARGRSIELYAIPSGNLLTSFPRASWLDPTADNRDVPTVACSPTGTRVAIVSGSRLTFHDLK